MKLNSLGSLFVVLLACGATFGCVETVNAQGLLSRIFGRNRNCQDQCPPCRQVCPTREPEMHVGSCKPVQGKCHILASGTLSPNESGSQPKHVYMIVLPENGTCPACGTGPSSFCTMHQGSPWIKSNLPLIWNPNHSGYDVSFGTVASTTDPRVVDCNSSYKICFVICYMDNTCYVETHERFNPAQYCTTQASQGHPCPGCIEIIEATKQ